MVIKNLYGPWSYYMHVLWPCMYKDYHTCMHYEHSTCMYYGHGRCSTMAIIRACTMAMVHACIMAIAPAFTMAIVHAWSMGIIRACTAIVHALHACTLQKNDCFLYEHVHYMRIYFRCLSTICDLQANHFLVKIATLNFVSTPLNRKLMLQK